MRSIGKPPREGQTDGWGRKYLIRVARRGYILCVVAYKRVHVSALTSGSGQMFSMFLCII